jgi:hypothetical protein
MIYLRPNLGPALIFLEPANLAHIQSGEFIGSPDGSTVLGFTPDAVWLSERIIAAAGILNDGVVKALHAESLRRAPVFIRHEHPMRQIIMNGKVINTEEAT